MQKNNYFTLNTVYRQFINIEHSFKKIKKINKHKGGFDCFFNDMKFVEERRLGFFLHFHKQNSSGWNDSNKYFNFNCFKMTPYWHIFKNNK